MLDKDAMFDPCYNCHFGCCEQCEYGYMTKEEQKELCKANYKRKYYESLEGLMTLGATNEKHDDMSKDEYIKELEKKVADLEEKLNNITTSTDNGTLDFSKWWKTIDEDMTVEEKFILPDDIFMNTVFKGAVNFIYNVLKFKYCYDRGSLSTTVAKSPNRNSDSSYMITVDSKDGHCEPIEMEFFEYPNMESLIPGLYFSSIEKAKMFVDWANNNFHDDFIDYPIK